MASHSIFLVCRNLIQVYYRYDRTQARTGPRGSKRRLEQRTGIGLTMSEQLKWTEGLQQHASRDKAHYVIHERSDGKWDVAVYGMFTDEPDAAEQWLGDYLLETQADAMELAQALADQRGRFW